MRKKKLVHPRIQLKITSWFLCVIVSALVLQFMLLSWQLSDVVTELPADPSEAYAEVQGAVLRTMLLSLCVVTPVCIFIGIRSTFRLTGPIYRFRAFLEGVRRGDHPDPCVLRDGDELQDICRLLNDVTEPVRADMASDETDRRVA